MTNKNQQFNSTAMILVVKFIVPTFLKLIGISFFGEAKESAKKPKKASRYYAAVFLAGAQYFHRSGGPMKICCIIFVGWMGR
jgi:hypothetical protein